MSHTFAEITSNPIKAAASLREVAETARRDASLIAMLVQGAGDALPDQLERDYLNEVAAALAAAAEKARIAADVLCSDVTRN